MRILMVSDDRGDIRLGAGKAARELASALRVLGHDCDHVFSEDLGAWPAGTRLRLAAGPALAWRAVRRALRHQPPYDVVDAASAAGWMLGAAPALVARTHGLEHFYYRELLADARAGVIHKGWARRLWFPLTRLPQVAAGFRRATRAIALNTAERDFMIARGWKRPGEVEVIANGIRSEDWRHAPVPGAPRGAGLLFCGSWYSAKGVAYLVAAHAQLAQAGLRLPLTVLGPAVDGAWAEQRARVLGDFAPHLRELVTVLPRTDHLGVLEQFARHDLLISASVMEGCSLTILEAMGQRLPVVGTRVGAAGDLLEAESVALVAPRDATGLAQAIARLWRDPAARAAQAGRAYAAAGEFTWERAARRTAAVYAATREAA